MRLVSWFLVLFCWSAAQAQSSRFAQLLARGKAEFSKEEPRQNYRAAVTALEAAVQLKPGSAEAHYYLGYAYSRLNSKDGNTLYHARAALTQKASREMETVNRLAPRYPGRLIVLDPYAKITSEWGSLAVAYAVRQQPDSARWAFGEGKKHGGFDEFLLQHARALLDQCRLESILLSPGDLLTFPLAYVQLHDNYRPDVLVTDLALLGTRWYPEYLQKTYRLQFGMSAAERDSVEYVDWHTGPFTVFNALTQADFTWKVYPTYDSTYLQRSDALLLSLLRANEFRRDVYFTHGFAVETQVGLRLNQELLQKWVVYQVNASHEPEPTTEHYLARLGAILTMVPLINPNSRSELEMVLTLRYSLLDRLQRSIRAGREAEVRPVLALLDQYIPEARFPFEAPDEKEFCAYLRTLP